MRNPGADGILGTPDDVLGSLGVARTDSNGSYVPDPVFGHDVQVTGRLYTEQSDGGIFCR